MGKLLRKLNLDTALTATAACCLAAIMCVAYMRARFPLELNYEEGNILNAGLRVLRGSTPYPDPASFPYLLNPYGPVGYILAAAGLKVFGVSLFGPRLLVLVAGVIIVFVLAGLTRGLGSRWRVGFLMGVFFLSTPLPRLWYPLLRVDFWAVLFSLLGLLAFLSFRRAWFIPLILFVLAILTKLTAVAAPLACVAELVLQRRLKRAFAMAAGVAGVFAASALYTGDSFSFHQFQTHPEPYSITRALEFYGVAFTHCLLAVGVIVYTVAVGLRSTPKARLGWLYLAACSATAFSAGNPAADTNHLLEWSAAVCLVAALALGLLLERRDPLARLLVSAFVVSTAFWTWQLGRVSGADLDRKGCTEAYAFIGSFPGDRVLSEDVTPLVLAGKPVLASNLYVTAQLGSSVNWAQGSLAQLAAREYFDLIVTGREIGTSQLDSARWPPDLAEAISRQYRLVRRLDCPPHFGAAYIPKTPADGRYRVGKD